MFQDFRRRGPKNVCLFALHAGSSKQPNPFCLSVADGGSPTLRNVCTLVVNSFPPTLNVMSPSSYRIGAA